MSKKDEDIEKLKSYSYKLGIPVRMLKYSRTSGCLAYYAQGSHIVIFKASNTTKTDIIMSLLHELGHHLDWVKNRKRNSKEIEKAYSGFTSGKPVAVKNVEERRKYTKIILDTEKAGISYMRKIAKDLKLNVSMDRVKRQQVIDIFHYQVLHEKGEFPSGKEVRAYERLILNGK